MKKNLVMTMLMSTLTAGMFSTFTACSDDDMDLSTDGVDSIIDDDMDDSFEYVPFTATCYKPMYFVGNTGNISDELQKAIDVCFPYKAGSFEDAEIAIIDASTALAQEQNIKRFCDRGGLMVCLFPDNSLVEVGYDDLLGCNELLWATHYDGDDYYLLDGPDEVLLTDEEGNESFERVEKNQNYWSGRLLPLIEWIEYCDEKEASITRGANDVPSFDELTINMNNGAKHFEVNFPFALYHQIDKGTAYSPDNLYKNGSVTMRFEVMPIYAQSVNGDAAGDYYAVRSTVVPHNSLVWGPYVGCHKASRNRVYGYWFDDMDYEFVLVDPDTNQPVDGLHFADLPYPENSIAAREHTRSHSTSVNGSFALGGKASKGKESGIEGSIDLSVGFAIDWTESISYSLNNIDYSRNSSTNWVKYHWYSNNVELKDDMNNYQKYFPNDVHQEFDAKNVWLWHVPYNRAGVADGSEKQFKLLARVHPRYSSWYHWRGTRCFSSNRKDWEVDFNGKYTSTDKEVETNFSTHGWASCTFSLPAPDRSTWGIISLKNASSYTMRNVKIYASGKENKGPVAEIPDTYASKEIAKTAVLEGTYTVTFELINPDNNQVLHTGVVNNVKVKMGSTQDAATTVISTGNSIMD